MKKVLPNVDELIRSCKTILKKPEKDMKDTIILIAFFALLAWLAHATPAWLLVTLATYFFVDKQTDKLLLRK